MRTWIKIPFRLHVLTTAPVLMLAGPVTGQTITTLHSFTSRDGSRPAGLTLVNQTLYGTANLGGSNGKGTVFRVDINGNGFSNLYNFTAYGNSAGIGTNLDGGKPYGPLASANGALYGTATTGGAFGWGTVFKLNPDGTGFTNLHSFTGHLGGGAPQAGLLLSGSTLFGTTSGSGGSYGTDEGTIFAINIDGTGFTNLHSFTDNLPPLTTNTDGATPYATLMLLTNTLYGTAKDGGIPDEGTVFAVNPDGTAFTTLYSFTSRYGSSYTNSDGANPNTPLILVSNTLYGAAFQGGGSGRGTIFKVNTDGTEFSELYTFPSNSIDGFAPNGLILSGKVLCGTTSHGGSSGFGTAFEINLDGTGFTTLHNFTSGADGGYPTGFLSSSNNMVFGTTSQGGVQGQGAVFRLALPAVPPQLEVSAFASGVTLMWPTNSVGFTLQSTTKLGASAIWATNLPAPVIVNGEFTVTNPISGAQQFFRLAQ